jgi:hypothetical protein
MATYAICYDIHPSRGDTYDPLINGIKGLGTHWWHHLDSTWLVVTTLTAAQIRDRLQALLPYSDDQLLVINVSHIEAAWRGFDNDGSQWLKTNLA